MRQADLTNPALPLPVANWTLCLEVAEHIPKHLEAAFLANVAKTNSRGLVLSWANQPGNGHVNNRAPKQVVERLQQLGYVAPAPNLNVIKPYNEITISSVDTTVEPSFPLVFESLKRRLLPPGRFSEINWNRNSRLVRGALK